MFRSPWSVLGCLALALTGCGGVGNVSGTVSYQDKPLTAGSVVFQGRNNSVTAPIDPQGNYKAVGVPSGEVKVAVLGPPASPPLNPKMAAMMKGQAKTVGQGKEPEAAATTPASAKAVKIPSEYADPEKSGITLTVSTGDNPAFDIKLK